MEIDQRAVFEQFSMAAGKFFHKPLAGPSRFSTHIL